MEASNVSLRSLALIVTFIDDPDFFVRPVVGAGLLAFRGRWDSLRKLTDQLDIRANDLK